VEFFQEAGCRGVWQIQGSGCLDKRPGSSKSMDIDVIAIARFSGWADALMEVVEKVGRR
jgi:hypothetical protein